MNWYIGQEIVAVRNHSQGAFKEGDIFPIKGLRNTPCSCNYIEIDIGIYDDNGKLNCTSCRTIKNNPSHIWWMNEISFRPLDELADISELTEILETTQPFEVK